MSLSKLFETTKINGMKLRNRFVRSATWTGLAGNDGTSSRKLETLLSNIAEGGVGLIITGHVYVLKNGQAGPWQLGIDDEKFMPGLRILTQAVHDSGGKIVIQLSHAGIYADPKLTGSTPWAVSNVHGMVEYPVKEMNPADIETFLKAFQNAAEKALAAGFDGIQIHAAHGYLINQFLSPRYNQRYDRYGGEIENRSFVLIEVIRHIRSVVGPDFPILVKLNSQDFLDNGLELEDSLRIGKMLEQANVDAIEISGGTRASGAFKSSRTGILTKNDEAYFKVAARLFKQVLNIPVILVGGVRSYDVAESLVGSNNADYIAMCRPLIREPDLINRWKSGDHERAACISCNECMAAGLNGKGVQCKEL